MTPAFSLRPYQSAAVDATLSALAEPGVHPLVVVPTAGGKTIIFASLIDRLLVQKPRARFCVLAHSRELLEQAHEKITRVVGESRVGLFSAALRQWELGRQITIAGIQSIWKYDYKPFDYLVIDEAHMIPVKAEDSRYRTFIRNASRTRPGLKAIGFTATPWRLDGGMIAQPGRAMNRIAYEVGVSELIAQGYISLPRTTVADTAIDTSGIGITAGEFNQGEAQRAVDKQELVSAAVSELVKRGEGRRSWLVFCCGVEHARHVADELRHHGVGAVVVHGGMERAERRAVLDGFRAGDIRAVVNVDVWTTGVDVPGIDLIALLRPTASVARYVQMVGRGFRVAPGKEDFLVLDFAGNIDRHGPINQPKVREPEKSENPPAPAVPPDPAPRDASHDAVPSEAPILSEDLSQRTPGWELTDGQDDILIVENKQEDGTISANLTFVSLVPLEEWKKAEEVLQYRYVCWLRLQENGASQEEIDKQFDRVKEAAHRSPLTRLPNHRRKKLIHIWFSIAEYDRRPAAPSPTSPSRAEGTVSP